MKPEIVVISPSEFFAEKIRDILDRRELHFPVYVATGEETISLAGRLSADGVKVIISRGRNVRLLRDHATVAVVEVLYTYEDIYHSYREARRYSSKIAFFGMDLAYGIGCTFRELSGLPLHIPEINDPSEIEPVLDALVRKQKVGCVIGGDTVKEMALKYGVKYVNTWVTPSSIELAINEALGLLKVELERRRNEWLVGSILDSSNNGTIALDENNALIYSNHRARQLLRNNEREFLTLLLADTALSDAFQENASIANHLMEFANATLSIDCNAIMPDGVFSGYAITIRDSREISDAENEIRRKLARQYNVAKKTLHDISGNSAAIRSVVAKAKKYAASESTVLITGESGTGKEVFAQGIHNQSTRRDGPFVAINCAAIAENVLESELFGYVKGAFTGARAEGKAGVFEHAHTGTIFLDEIGEISRNMQVKLLRVLQEREIVRIGDMKNIPVDVRVIAATNLDLATLVAENKFRLDLFYRLCVLELRIPSLRERAEDIGPLIESILLEYPYPIQISDKALKLLSAHHYPGNIRQLQNIVERLVVTSDNNRIDETLTADILAREPHLAVNPAPDSDARPGPVTMEKSEELLILSTLRQFHGNKAATCKALGISKSTLWRKLKQFR